MTKKKKGGNTAATLEVPPPRDVQATINELVYRHGLNFRNQDAPRIDALRAAGIDPDAYDEDKWDQMWFRAEEVFNNRLKAEAEGRKLTWSLVPVREDWSTGPVTLFQSQCGRYCITRFDKGDRPKHGRYAAENGKPGKRKSVEHDPAVGKGYARYYDTFADAIKAVHRHHLKEYGLDAAKFSDNSGALIAVEKDFPAKPDEPASVIMGDEGAGNMTGPDIANTDTEKEVPTVSATAIITTVKEGAARALLKALGVSGVEDMTVKTLGKKLLKVDTYTETTDCPDEGTSERRTLDKIQAALKDGDDIQVVADEESNGHGEPAAAAPPVPRKGKKAKDKVKPGRKSKAAASAAEPAPRKKSGPSMVGTVIELLRKASEDKPITKDRIHAQLMKKWPDHNPDSVKDSVSWYISTMQKKQGIEVRKDGKGGFWIEGD